MHIVLEYQDDKTRILSALTKAVSQLCDQVQEYSDAGETDKVLEVSAKVGHLVVLQDTVAKADYAATTTIEPFADRIDLAFALMNDKNHIESMLNDPSDFTDIEFWIDRLDQVKSTLERVRKA